MSSLFQRLPTQSSAGKWPDPQLSSGQFIVKVDKDSIWEAIGPARDAFEILAPSIKEYLERSVEPISSWVTWSIYMMGRAVDKASPTIIFCSEALKHRRDIRKAIKESGLLSRFPGFKTGHMSRPPDFDQLVPLADEVPLGSGKNTPAVSAIMTKRACGMQLFINGSTTIGSTWSRKATVGGVIKVNDKYFYTTAGHPFSEDSDEDSDAFSFDEDSDVSDVCSDTSAEVEEHEQTSEVTVHATAAAGPAVYGHVAAKTIFMRTLSKVLDNESTSHLISRSTSKETLLVTPGPELGIVLQKYFGLTNTAFFLQQLKLYGFHKVQEELTGDISEHAIWEFKHEKGPLHGPVWESFQENQQPYSRQFLASNQDPLPSPPISTFSKTLPEPQQDSDFKVANLRVQTRSNKSTSLDYALVEVDEAAHMAPNHVDVSHEPPKHIECKSLGNFGSSEWPVLALTARGAIPGTLCMAPSYLLTPVSTTYCETRFARFEAPLEEGDSGSWVVHKLWGDLFGHIVAGSPQKGMAVVVPFSAVFSDIEATMGSSPQFPVQEAENAPLGDDYQSALTTTAHEAHHSGGLGNRELFKKEPPNFVTLLHPAGPSRFRTETPNNFKCSQCTRAFVSHQLLENHLQIHKHEELYPCRTCGIEFRRQDDLALHAELHEEIAPHVCPKCDRTFAHTETWVRHIESDCMDIQQREDDESELDHGAHRDLLPNEAAKGSTPTHGPPSHSSQHLPQTAAEEKPSAEGNAQMAISRSPSPSYGGSSSFLSLMAGPKSHAESHRFRSLLITLSATPMEWEDREALGDALQIIPFDRLYEEANEAKRLQEALSDENMEGHWDFDDFVIKALMHWFKRVFFTWVNNPPCSICLSPTLARGKTEPTPAEAAHSARVVELYCCSNVDCGSHERFPRYRNARQLLQTRRGRVGEWANCFGLLCRALDARVRWVWNSEDHAWVEILSKRQNRWVHIDATEGAWDDPLLYTEGKGCFLPIDPVLSLSGTDISTSGWGKRMGYCIAFSVDGVADVTHRYVRTSDHALARQACSEDALLDFIDEIRTLRRNSFSGDHQLRLDCEDFREEEELRLYINTKVPHQGKQPEKTSRIVPEQTRPQEYKGNPQVDEHQLQRLTAATN